MQRRHVGARGGRRGSHDGVAHLFRAGAYAARPRRVQLARQRLVEARIVLECDLDLEMLAHVGGDQGVGAARRTADVGLDRHVVDPYPLVAVADAGEPVAIGDHPRRHGGQHIPNLGSRASDGGKARGGVVLRGRVDRDSIHVAIAVPYVRDIRVGINRVVVNLPPVRSAGVFVCLSGGADHYATIAIRIVYIDDHVIVRFRQKIERRAGRKGKGQGSGVCEGRVAECQHVAVVP